MDYVIFREKELVIVKLADYFVVGKIENPTFVKIEKRDRFDNPYWPIELGTLCLKYPYTITNSYDGLAPTLFKIPGFDYPEDILYVPSAHVQAIFKPKQEVVEYIKSISHENITEFGDSKNELETNTPIRRIKKF